MTPRRRAQFRAERDARVRQAAAPVLAQLRERLLVAPSDRVIAAHVEMMRLECQLVEPTPAFSGRRRAARRTSRHSLATLPRRPVCIVATICLAVTGCSLDAVGALPEPLQQFSDSIKHHLGIPAQPPLGTHPTKSSSGLLPSKTNGSSPGTADGTATPGSTGAPGSRSGRGARAGGRSSSPTFGTTPASSPTSPTPTDPGTPGTTTLPPPPPDRHPTGGTPGPGVPSWGGPPAGFPADWKQRAIETAQENLRQCAASDGFAPVHCPQRAAPKLNSGTARWTLLNEPLAGAVAVGQPSSAPIDGSGAGTQVVIYGRFQMNGSYTVPGRKTPSNVFSGGLAKATVVFDGVSFQPLGVEPILDNQLPSDVHVPLFAHPAAVANSAVLTAVQTGFQACAISVAVPTDPNIANCPQSNAVVGSGTNLQWSLVGDPLNSARVAFDGIRGDFTVTGSYAMQVTFDGATPDEHNMATVLGGYVATLSYDGTSLQLLSISGS